ncbi:MAG: hypothetical protein JM58_11230 [Peptococcaceae bacterium BICA1-8]|nr:MAG: hypothetical protein JM58_11230 [Peptococcaceae bacterium BICA1-8]
MNKIRTAIISDSASNWPIYIGLEQDIFSKHGLEVEVTLTNSSKTQLEDMENGVYNLGFAAADHIIKRVVNNNSDLFMCFGVSLPFYNLVTSPEFKSYTQLKGKKIGVDGKNSGYALLLKTLLEFNNVSASECEFVELGGSGKRFNALKTGQIEGTFLDAPSDIEAELIGFNSLGSNLDCIPNYQGRIAAVKKNWAEKNEDILVSFISGYIEAVDWFYDTQNHFAAVEILRQKLDLSMEVVEAAYVRYMDKKIFNEKGLINESGINEVIKVMQKLGQISMKPDFSAFYDEYYYNKARG